MSAPPDNAAAPLGVGGSQVGRRWEIDLFTSYLLAAARVGSNVLIFALLYRYTNERYAATYALIRSMFLLLNYVFGGLNPTLQRLLAVPFARQYEGVAAPQPTGALPYASFRERRRTVVDEAHVLLAHANLLSSALVLLLAIPVVFYAENFSRFHDLSLTRVWHANEFAVVFGLGMLLRLWSEPSGALLQLRGRLWLDNLILIFAECAWVVLALFLAEAHRPGTHYGVVFGGIAVSFLLINILTLISRRMCASLTLGVNLEPWLDLRWSVLKGMALASAAVSLGQFADFLYAPANILIINAFIHPSAVARYAPALQIDAGLLLLVGAVATVLLPRAMAAWAAGERVALRRLYLCATVACLIILAAAALVVGVFIEPILRLWLGTVPHDTPTLTRLVLIHTVVGGTAGVARAVLLGMGRFRAYTLSALLGGIANVLLALLFVLVFNLGLNGIVYATILAVTLRCAVWMPWYILRALRDETPQVASSGHST